MQIIESNDILSQHPELIVHPVNCAGLCHDVFTHQLKKTWPMYFREYTRSCLRKTLTLHFPMLCDLGTMISTRYVLALPIRSHWREVLKPDTLRISLDKLVEVLNSLGVRTIAIPDLPDVPPGWLQKEISRRLEQTNNSALKSIFIFKQ